MGASMDLPSDENWRVLLSLLPRDWQNLALHFGAIERLRGFDSAEAVLRTLLFHVGKGYSLRESAVQARLAGVASVSDVTILNRLRQAGPWFQRMCQLLLEESGVTLPDGPAGRHVRVLDGTLVQEPGRTGSSWRIHYSIRLPSLLCDHLELTSTRGQGTGEILHRFPASQGDLILADRGFCTPVGIEALREQGADVIVRWKSSSLPLYTPEGKPFALLPELSQLTEPQQVGDWPVTIRGRRQRWTGRLIALRKSEAATRRARKKIQRKAQQGGPQTKPETLEYAAYVILFTTLPAEQFSGAQVLEWYRLRWQIELVFKRLKTLAQLGHLPKEEPDSARSWLYGKLLVALLAQKLIRVGRSISPWGYLLSPQTQR